MRYLKIELSKFVFSRFYPPNMEFSTEQTSDTVSTTSATTGQPFTQPNGPLWNVLIPRNVPGVFYYPPCKCELVNQIRYYNAKSREFYYHTAFTVPPGSIQQTPEDALQLAKPPVLAGEPEVFEFPPQTPSGGQNSNYFDPYAHHLIVRDIVFVSVRRFVAFKCHSFLRYLRWAPTKDHTFRWSHWATNRTLTECPSSRKRAPASARPSWSSWPCSCGCTRSTDCTSCGKRLWTSPSPQSRAHKAGISSFRGSSSECASSI